MAGGAHFHTSHTLLLLQSFPHTLPIPYIAHLSHCSSHPSLIWLHAHVIADSLCESGKHNSDQCQNSTSDCLETET